MRGQHNGHSTHMAWTASQTWSVHSMAVVYAGMYHVRDTGRVLAVHTTVSITSTAATVRGRDVHG